jgi:hypothetical protein
MIFFKDLERITTSKDTWMGLTSPITSREISKMLCFP